MKLYAIRVNIEVHNDYGPDFMALCRYLVHGWDDMLWTNDIEEALAFLKESLLKCAA